MSLEHLASLDGDAWPLWQSVEATNGGWAVALIAHPELRWFKGHFEGHPVLPGVVQTHIAATCARRLMQPKLAFSGISNLKFQQIVQPGDALLLALKSVPGKPAIDFSLTREGVVCSRGRLKFEHTTAA